jgi:serine/threonine protein kinase
MTTKCPKCHFENQDGIHYCGNCATPLTSLGKEKATRTKTMETPVEALVRGTRVADRYEIIELLGSGGMGKVYRVEDTKVEEEIALKIIHPEIAIRKKNLERFRQELKLTRKINHKNVCQMFDLGEDAQRVFITMEYVPGENLKTFIKRSKRLDIGTAISISKQICEGLAEAHKQGVIHRDLKSSNIMIDRDGNVRIMDFGIARSLESKRITGEGFTVGTPEYMSPEQVSGKDLNQTSDIYSFGIILFEMLTGGVPFDGDSSLDIALQHKVSPPPDPREINVHITDELSLLIFKCLDKDRERRYQKAEEVFAELSKIEREIPTKERSIAGRKSQIRPGFREIKPFIWPGIVVLFFIMVAGYLFFERIFPSSGKKQQNTIAVLPFLDISDKKDQEAICDMMTRDIIAKLSSCQGLDVVSYRTFNAYAYAEKSNKEIGNQLGVAMILGTYLMKEGEKYHIMTQLINAGTEIVKANFNEEGTFEDLGAVQDNLTSAIANTLGLQISGERLMALKKREPGNTEAKKYLTYGVFFNEKYLDNNYEDEYFNEAIKNLKLAIEFDGSYALTYWELGNVYHNRFVDGAEQKDFELMMENYTKAYNLDPNLAEANSGLGWAHFYMNEWDEAFKYYERCLQLNPTDPEGNYYVAGFFRDIGLYDIAIELYQKAIQADPVYKEYRQMCARCYESIGEFEKGSKLLEEGLKNDQQDTQTRLLNARFLVLMGKYERAEAESALVEKTDPGNPESQYIRAYLYAIRGEKDRALAVIQELNKFKYTYLITSVYSILGLKDEAINNIQSVIDEGFRELKTFPYNYQVLNNNPFYGSLRDDLRFQEIVDLEYRKYQVRQKKYSDIQKY